MADLTPNIRQSFETALAAVADLPDIAWENITYKPVDIEPYIKPRLVPTRREPSSLGLNPQFLYQGYFLIECFTPEGQGPAAGDALAAEILEAFEATTDLVVGSNKIHFRYAERDLGATKGAHYMVPVRIGYQLYG